MAAESEELVFRQKIRAGDLGSVKQMLKAEVDYAQAGQTVRQWTPLHIACWGSLKPQNDREIVEAILMCANKEGKEKFDAVISAKDAVDEKTPCDLAKERRDACVGNSVDDKEQLDEKRKFDKIVEWLEKGLPA